jgi:hypothetical protein
MLRQVAKDHADQVLAVQGEDREWPLWYSEHLLEPMNTLMGTALSRSEVVYLIVAADAEQKRTAPACDWPSWYASWILERYRLDG